MKNASKTKQYAITAVLSALSCAIMLATNYAETASLSVAAIASLPVLILLCEYGSSCAVASYLITAIISLLLCPLKSAPIAYAAFFGVYPMLKRLAESKRKALRLTVKASTLAVACTAYALSAYLFFPEEFIETPIYYYLFVPVCVLAFLMYDKCLTLFLRVYAIKLRPKIAKFL